MPRAEQGGADVALPALITRQLHRHGHTDDPDVARLVAAIRRRHGSSVRAILLYGSYLRGKRDTLLDFYVLLDTLSGTLPRAWHAAGNRWLPPNVYHLSLPEAGLRAKYATLTLDQFEQGMGRFHCYFWSRFTQPAGLVFAAGDGDRQRVADAMAAAVDAFVRRVAPGLDGPFPSEALWRSGLGLTYACELRSEQPGGVDALYRHHAAHFDELLEAYAGAPGAAIRPEGAGYRAAAPATRRLTLAWRARQAQGKVLSVLRLVKAAGTFDDPLDYLLWKIERHSGIYIEPTPRQRRYPLVFAWGLLWRLYRRGAFR